MDWTIMIKKDNQGTYYALFLDVEGDRMLVGIFERKSLISDEILENAKWEGIDELDNSPIYQ